MHYPLALHVSIVRRNLWYVVSCDKPLLVCYQRLKSLACEINDQRSALVVHRITPWNSGWWKHIIVKYFKVKDIACRLLKNANKNCENRWHHSMPASSQLVTDQLHWTPQLEETLMIQMSLNHYKYWPQIFTERRNRCIGFKYDRIWRWRVQRWQMEQNYSRSWEPINIMTSIWCTVRMFNEIRRTQMGKVLQQNWADCMWQWHVTKRSKFTDNTWRVILW